MSKITFRADEELVERLEALDASKSELMREALRAYLDGAGRRSGSADRAAQSPATGERALDDALAARVDRLIEERLETRRGGTLGGVDVTVTLDDRAAGSGAARRGDEPRKTVGGAPEPTADERDRRKTCERCGEGIDDEHTYCPNCGGKASRRVFCECGDEIRSDWSFCPGCGRRTATADVLDRP